MKAIQQLTASPPADSGDAERMVARLVGRQRDLHNLNDSLSRACDRAGSALLVRGEVGIGKSALLAAAAALAGGRGMRVLSVTGVQAETHIPFAGLHQLLSPVLDLAEELPSRQRDAIRAAFGMSGDGAPELFLVGLAALEMIADAAGRSPVLLIADDAQWIDQSTCEVLSFLGRRLAAEPAVLLIAIRDGAPSLFDEADIAELRLHGLDEEAASMLLDVRVPGLEPALRERLLREAAGNPLALVELPAAVQSEHLDEASLLSRLPLTERLERAFAGQASELPAATRAVLLIAAADDGSDLNEILGAASRISGAVVTVDLLEPALVIRLAEMRGTRLRFRHPLVRSAIYQAASLTERQAAHAALSDVLSGQPDRQVWHRAAATLGPDENVAEDLDRAAGLAERRGAVAVAIATYQRAAELSARPADQGRRLLEAADLAFGLGRPGLGPRLLRAAEPLDLPAEERARLSWLREAYDESGWSGAARIGFFVETAEKMRVSGRPDLALESLLAVALRCWWGNPSPQVRAAVTAVAKRLPVPQDLPALLAVLAHADPVQNGARVIERLSAIAPDLTDPEGMYLLGQTATAVWACELSLKFLDAAVPGLRAQGRIGMLAKALTTQAWAAVHLARQPVAMPAAAEAVRLTRETGQPRWAIAAELAQAAIAAERADLTVHETLARSGEQELRDMGANPMLGLVRFVRGRAAVTHLLYPEALGYLQPVLDPASPVHHPFVGTWGLSDLLEAAVHAGSTDLARDYLQRLETLAAVTSGPLLLAEAAYARPLVAADHQAEELYQKALEQDLTGWPSFRGRMLLWYGRWLRRQRRVAESRAPLRAARDAFDALGFSELAETARRELRASGETSRRRVAEAWDQLTPQEIQIAQMAAHGLSNREIGQQLFISHRTVGYHLHRIFPKLGITSRSQLHAALLSAAPNQA